jgi:hypothetical protein
MQRLSTAGYEWAFGGEIVRSSTNILQDSLPLELSDGRCVAVWEESFDGSQLDVLSMGYDPDGSGAWGPVDVISGPDFERLYDVLADPAGGFFVAGTQWDMVANDDVYLARLDGNGGHAPDSPTFLTTGKAAYFLQLATADEGVWVAWNDNRYLPDYALFVQRVTRGLVPQLDGEGRQVFRSFGQECYLKDAEADGAGGLLLGWTDSRSWPSGADIYTQRVDAAGLSMWDRDGVCLRVSEAGNFFSDLVPDGSGGLLCIFDESIDGVRSLFAQRIERNGYWGYPAPVIAAVRDVPDDQGGQVLLSWDASRLDAWPEQGVDYYTLWGALPEAKAAKTPTDDWIDRVGPESTRKDVVRADNTGVKTTYWQHLGTVIAQMFPGYLEVVPTLADSSSAGPADQVFQVIAHGDGDGEFWSSNEVVGRSVDNLAPGPPQNLAGVVDYPAEAMVLSWDGPVAPDLAEFVIHRGVAADFVPGPSSLVATTPDTSYSDGDWTRTGIWYYKVAAVDVHGNASPYALLEPRDVAPVGDGGGLPAVTALLPNHPNPFNPRTQVVFEVSRRTTLSLRIYDFGGRLVRVLLAAEPVPAGRHEVVWDGRDHLGRRVSAGVYFCHLDSGSVSQTKKMTLLK